MIIWYYVLIDVCLILCDMRYMIHLWIVMIPSSCWCKFIIWYDIQGHLDIICSFDSFGHVSMFFLWINMGHTYMMIWYWYAYTWYGYIFFDDLDALICRSTLFCFYDVIYVMCVMMWFICFEGDMPMWLCLLICRCLWYVDELMIRILYVMNVCSIILLGCNVCVCEMNVMHMWYWYENAPNILLCNDDVIEIWWDVSICTND